VPAHKPIRLRGSAASMLNPRSRPVVVPLMGLPLVPMTVGGLADAKQFVRGTTRDQEAPFLRVT
jgi:hypothetical protein